MPKSAEDKAADAQRMAKLIDDLAIESGHYKNFTALQKEVVHRVQEEIFQDESAKMQYQSREDSVFDYVEQHKLNEENGLNLFAEQFQKVHGQDHLRFTERWFLEEAGWEIQLEGMLEHPTFADFAGVIDMVPMENYGFSKMVIDEADFMGIFDLGNERSQAKAKSTYAGVESHQFTEAEVREVEAFEVEKARGHPHGPHEDKESCCGATKIHPHKLGQGEYLQFKVRRENVEPYANNWLTTQRLLSLAPADPKTTFYIFTASANGVMRFHPQASDWRMLLWLAYLDSSDLAGLAQNMAHAHKYGCFCFGVVYKEKTNYVTSSGQRKKGGRTIIMRYNRWATDNVPLVAFVVQHHDNQDPSVPTQPSCCCSLQ
ncbi:unnamed protein product [Effrenium voratum]|nr:unnamed protein product [Effrenium voratum]